MPEWVNIFGDDISAAYNSLRDVGDINSIFLKTFDKIDIAAEMDIPEGLKALEKYRVDESLYSKYKKDLSTFLDRYDESLKALIEYIDEIDIGPESTVEAADALKVSIAESNKVLGFIGDSEDRKDILLGALLLEEYLGEIQETVNFCLTDIGDDFKFYDNYLVTFDAGTIMGMLYRLKNIYTNGQEFKARALESLGYEIEGVDAELLNPYASGKVAVRKNKKQ